MIDFTLTIQGTAPLLMHSARLSDPLDPATKALKKVSSKRTKTDDDHAAVAEAEFRGGLYLDPDVGPYLPGENIMATLVGGAKLNKLGTKVTRGLLIKSDVNPIAYTGPRTADGLWADPNYSHRASVKVGTSRVIRTRPIFREWTVQCDGVIDESQLDISEVATIAENAGAFIGLGDWRPRFGRFTATVEAVR